MPASTTPAPRRKFNVSLSDRMSTEEIVVTTGCRYVKAANLEADM
jgi:hypothetical protein